VEIVISATTTNITDFVGDMETYIYNRNIAGYNLIKHSLQTNLDVEKPWFPSEDDRKWLVYRRAKSQTKELMRNHIVAHVLWAY